MKLMYLRSVRTAFFVALGLALINTSCSKKEDSLTKPEEETTPVDPGTGLPAGFNWSTSKTVSIRAAVADKDNGQFYSKYEIFDREPHLAGAILLDAGLAKDGQDLEAKVTIPANMSQVFLQKTSPIGEVSYSIIELNGSNAVNASKAGVSAKMAALNTNGLVRVASTTPVSSVPPAVPTVPANAVAIKGKSDITTVPASKAFVIPAGSTFSGTIPALNTEGVVVYVQGKWHPGPAIEMGKNSKIVILPKGELNVDAINLNDGTATVENHGDVLLKSMKMTDATSFFNVGTLRIKGLVSMSAKANFVNYQKDVKVKIDAVTMTDAESVLTNNGEIEILVGSFTNGTLNANCYTTVGQMTANNATVNIWSDAMLDVTNLNAEESVFNLYARAVLDVTKTGTFKAKSGGNGVVVNTIGADAYNKSYVRIKYVRVDAANAVHLRYNGSIIVVTDEHPKRSDGTFVTTGTTDVEIYWNIYNHPPYVAATNCNAGGAGTTKPTTPPVDQKLEKVSLGTFTYLFEDNWPNKGDYDLNDLVLAVDVTKYVNKTGKIEKVVLKNTIYAIGAGRRLGAAIQLDNVSANAIKSVNYSDQKALGTRFPLDSKGIESGQAKAVVTVVNDAHSVFGFPTTTPFVFTHQGAANRKDPYVAETTIEFNTPLATFSFDDLNPFIASEVWTNSKDGLSRSEVHLVGRVATDKINAALATKSKTDGLLDARDIFKTADGWPFAIVVPVAQFKYQTTEGKHINEAYPQFTEWVNSLGTKNLDWYNFPGK